MSLADVLVLELYFGRKNATQIIEVLDPWCFSGETSKATIAIKGFSQSVLDKAKCTLRKKGSELHISRKKVKPHTSCPPSSLGKDPLPLESREQSKLLQAA
jgi:hypothetical protein